MTRCIVVAINPGLTFSPQFLPVASVDDAYTATINAVFGTPPYRFTHVSGALPDGVTFTDNGDGTATFAGTPTEAGAFSVLIRLKDLTRKTVERVYVLQAVALPLEVTGSLDNMTVGTPYNDTLSVSGGVSPRTIIASTRPAGITASILGDTITVSGTPTGAGLGPGSPKSFDVSITVEDDVGAQVIYTQTISITVPAVVWSPTYPDGTVDEAYDYTPSAATGGTGGYVYSYTGTLPPGLSFEEVDGQLHGTPTDNSGSPYAFVVTATDSEGNTNGGSAQAVEIDVNVTYATLNPSDKAASIGLTNGNLTATRTGSNANALVRANMARSSGKEYFEVHIDVSPPNAAGNQIGVMVGGTATSQQPALGNGTSGSGSALDRNAALQYHGTSGLANRGSSGLTTLVSGDVVMVAIDHDNHTMYVGKNGTWGWSGNPSAGTNPSLPAPFVMPTGDIYAAIGMFSNTFAVTVNFGATAFSYPVPTGYRPGVYSP